MNAIRAAVPALLALLLFGAAVPAAAQIPTATVLGTIGDSTGGALPGATIVARNVETGLVRTTVTDALGAYRLPALPVGVYSLSVELAGFGRQERAGLRLSVGQQAVLNFVLGVDALSETVTVTGAAPLLLNQVPEYCIDSPVLRLWLTPGCNMVRSM
jgi:hypothetical protein